MVSRLKTYGFLRLNSFFILSPFSPLAVPLYSYRERRTTISPLNPFAPGVFSLRIRQDYRSYCIFSLFCLDFIGFLMRQLLISFVSARWNAVIFFESFGKNGRLVTDGVRHGNNGGTGKQKHFGCFLYADLRQIFLRGNADFCLEQLIEITAV